MTDTDKLLSKLQVYEEKYGELERGFGNKKILADKLNLANLILNPNEVTTPKIATSSRSFHKDNADKIINEDTLVVKINAKDQLTEYTNYVLKDLGKMSEEKFAQNYKLAFEQHEPINLMNINSIYFEETKKEIKDELTGKQPEVKTNKTEQKTVVNNGSDNPPTKQDFIESIVNMAQRSGIKVNPVEGKEVNVIRLTMKNIENLLSNLTRNAREALLGKPISFRDEIMGR